MFSIPGIFSGFWFFMWEVEAGKTKCAICGVECHCFIGLFFGRGRPKRYTGTAEVVCLYTFCPFGFACPVRAGNPKERFLCLFIFFNFNQFL